MATRWCGAGIIGISFIVIMLEVLGSIGWLHRGPVTLASIALVCAASWRSSPFSLTDEVRRVCDWLRLRLQEGYGLLFCIAAVPVVQALTRGLRSPPLSWDSLEYHAFFPARWVQLGSLAPFAAPGGMDTCRAHPINGELLVAWVMLPFHGDLFVNLVSIPAMLLAAVALYAMARRLGAGPAVALWAPVVFCFSPPMWSLVTTQYSDILGVETTISGLLFLLRYISAWRRCDLFLAAAGFGLCAGTKHGGLLAAVLCCGSLVIVKIACRRVRPRNLALLGSAMLVAAATGGYQYIRNWIELGNPVYPAGISLGGLVLFEGSPHHAEIFRQFPSAGMRMADWNHFTGLFRPTQFSWGVPYLIMLPAAVLAAIRPGKQRAEKWLLTAVWVATIILFYAPDSGFAAHIRRIWPASSQRLLGPAMAIAVCLAVCTLGRLSWPTHLVGAIPTLTVLASIWCGRFPQPLSVGEAAVLVAAVVASGWLLSSEAPRRILAQATIKPAIAGVAVLAAVLLATAGTTLLEVRREAARYFHYGHSIDYHDFPREYVSAWRACDEADLPHIVAMTRNRTGTDKLSLISTATRWFLYPLLGSHLQNRVVYASIHELRDLPTRPYFGDPPQGGDERIWLQNLQRLKVDRLLVGAQTEPEEDWVAARPDVFVKISQGEGFGLYRVKSEAITSALNEWGRGMTGVATAEDFRE